MSNATRPIGLPEDAVFHCRSCNATRPCPPGEVGRCVADDRLWPRCCEMRMAVSFPHGHPELVTAPERPEPE